MSDIGIVTQCEARIDLLTVCQEDHRLLDHR